MIPSRSNYEIRSYPYFSSPVVYFGSCKVCGYSTGKRWSEKDALRSVQDHLRAKHGLELDGTPYVRYAHLEYVGLPDGVRDDESFG